MEAEAKQAVASALHAALATVNEDGSPCVIPVHLFIEGSELYWFSDASTRHSQNIERDPRVSITQWHKQGDEPSTAIYVQSSARLLTGADAEKAHTVARDRLESPQFDSLSAYGASLGKLDEVRSSEKRWYFYT